MSRVIPELISRMIPVNGRVDEEQRQQIKERGKQRKKKGEKKEKRKIKERTNRGINYLDYARAKREPSPLLRLTLIA